jgi:hypothetical protein
MPDFHFSPPVLQEPTLQRPLFAGAPMLATALIAMAIPSFSSAQDRSDAVGEVGLTFGFNDIIDLDNNAAGVGFAVIDGSFSFPVGSALLGFDAGYRFDDLASDPDFSDEEDPDNQYTLGAHLLFQLGERTRLGGFLAYGDTRMQDEPLSSNYDYWLVGLEARHFIGENLMGYAQFGVGDKGRTGDDEGEGFNNGHVARLGATYFVKDHSAFTLDLEYASADPYIDGDDAGRFYGVTLGGETRLGPQSPVMATYSIRYNKLDGTTENDAVEELQFGLGIKVLFGATSPREAARAGRSIGTPYLPSRASAWTEFLD